MYKKKTFFFFNLSMRIKLKNLYYASTRGTNNVIKQ